MKVIDKIFASFYAYYKDGYGKVKLYTPQEYTTYVMTIGVILWLICIDFIIDYKLFGRFKIDINILIGLIIAAIIYFFIYRRYIKSSFYLDLYEQYKKEIKHKMFWRVISILCIIFPLLFAFTLAIIWHKY